MLRSAPKERVSKHGNRKAWFEMPPPAVTEGRGRTIAFGMALPERPLRYGWTTGTCAAAAAKAAYTGLLTGTFPDPVEVTLPKGQRPAFALATTDLGQGAATAGVVKDAGDER